MRLALCLAPAQALYLSGVFSEKHAQGSQVLIQTLLNKDDPVVYGITHYVRPLPFRTRLHNDPFTEVGIMNYPDLHGYQAYKQVPTSFEDLRRPGRENREKVIDRNFDAVFDIWTRPPDLDKRAPLWTQFNKAVGTENQEYIFLVKEDTGELHKIHQYGTLRRYQDWYTLDEYLFTRNTDFRNVLDTYNDVIIELVSQFVELRKLASVFSDDEEVKRQSVTVQRQIQEQTFQLARELALRFKFETDLLTLIWRKVKRLHETHNSQHCMIMPESVWVSGWKVTSPFNISAIPELVAGAKRGTLIAMYEPNRLFPSFSGHQTQQRVPRMSYLLSVEPERFLALNALPLVFIDEELKEENVMIEGYSTFQTNTDDPKACLYPHLFLVDEVALYKLFTSTITFSVHLAYNALFAPKFDESESIIDAAMKFGVHPFNSIKRWLQTFKEFSETALQRCPNLNKLTSAAYEAEVWASQKKVSAKPGLVDDLGHPVWGIGWSYNVQNNFWADVEYGDDQSYAQQFKLDVPKIDRLKLQHELDTLFMTAQKSITHLMEIAYHAQQ